MARLSLLFLSRTEFPVLMTSGIIYVIKHGLQWKDAPNAYRPYKTLYNHFVRSSLRGVLDRSNRTPP